MINLLTKTQKDDFLMFNSILNLMEKSSLGFNQEEKETVKIATQMMLMVLDSYARRMTKTLLGEMIRLGKGANVVCLYEDTKIKQGVTVEVKDLDYLTEAALMTCGDCKRNWKQCGLRKSLHKIGAPMVDPEQSGCKFKFSK